MPDTKLSDAENECLKLKTAINDNHKRAQKLAEDAVERAVLVGELLVKWKELLPHGKFEKFVEDHFDGSPRSARAYMLAATRLSSLSNRQRTATLEKESSLSGLLESLKPQRDSVAAGRDARKPEGTPVTPKGGSNPPATASVSDKGKPGGAPRASSSSAPPSPGPASGEAADFGTCPNCGGKKWTEDEFGSVCAKCNHPHGEPVGDQDEDRIGTQRAKTVKTVEALMRAFDDLNRMLPRPEHVEAMASCKFLLKTARAWK